MAKIQPPALHEVESISFYCTPTFAPEQTAHDMLVWLMEQPWADIKVSNGQVVVADLRQTVGGTVCAIYVPSSAVAAPRAALPERPGVVLQFPSKRGALV